jgi:hypothetical protein
LVTTFGTDHVHDISHVEEVDEVLNRLHDFFGCPKHGNKVENANIFLSEQCGLHVHVGNERCGYPLPTVKKVLSTNVANERAIDNFHGSGLIGGSKLATIPLDKPCFDMTASNGKMVPLPYSPPWSEHFIVLAHMLKR